VGLLFAAGIACYALYCGGLSSVSSNRCRYSNYGHVSVDNLLSTVEVYSSIDSRLEPLCVANVKVSIRMDNLDSAVIYGSHAVVLQRMLWVVQWVLVILSQGCLIMSGTAI
jgi:hypothetical protein